MENGEIVYLPVNNGTGATHAVPKEFAPEGGYVDEDGSIYDAQGNFTGHSVNEFK